MCEFLPEQAVIITAMQSKVPQPLLLAFSYLRDYVFSIYWLNRLFYLRLMTELILYMDHTWTWTLPEHNVWDKLPSSEPLPNFEFTLCVFQPYISFSHHQITSIPRKPIVESRTGMQVTTEAGSSQNKQCLLWEMSSFIPVLRSSIQSHETPEATVYVHINQVIPHSHPTEIKKS